MAGRKIYCNVLEGITYDDRCLFKLSKVIEANPECENCILRLYERMRRGKAGRSGADAINMTKDTNDTKVTKVTKVTNGPKRISKRRRTKPRPKGKPGSIADA